MTTPAPRKSRLYRLFTPMLLVVALILGTILVRWWSEPSYSDAEYLSPATAGDTSGDKLAELLRARGITIARETRAVDALNTAIRLRGRATLFIPIPDFVHAQDLAQLSELPSGTRVVLVEPDSAQLFDALPPLGVADRRWATAATAPGRGCTLTDAGRAAVTRTRYGLWTDAIATAEYCYEHGLVAVDYQDVEFIVVGSPEPFRADRLSEHDNAGLAVDLLSTRPTLVWLDLHAKEAKPRVSRAPRPTPSRQPAAAERPSPFPDWLLPAVVMLLLAALAVIFARGRRLGAPVSEPLPIEVRGAETAIGRGELYRRAKARGAALETLRFEARRRIAAALGLPASAAREQLLGALATHTGEDPALLSDILYGPAPESDHELQHRTTELLLLVEQITRGPRQEGEPSD